MQQPVEWEVINPIQPHSHSTWHPLQNPNVPTAIVGACWRGPLRVPEKAWKPRIQQGLCLLQDIKLQACVWRKVQGSIFLEEGETKCNETVISLGLLQQNLHFSTSAAQPWVNQTMDFLFQENIKGLLLGKTTGCIFFPSMFMNKASTCFHDVWIRLQGVAGPPCSRIHLGLFLPSDPQPLMSFPDLFYTISHGKECSHTHGINNFPFNPANYLHILW